MLDKRAEEVVVGDCVTFEEHENRRQNDNVQ